MSLYSTLSSSNLLLVEVTSGMKSLAILTPAIQIEIKLRCNWGVKDSRPLIRSSSPQIYGEDGFIIFWPKIVLFYKIIGGGALNAPHQLKYVFDPATDRVNLNVTSICHLDVAPLEL